MKKGKKRLVIIDYMTILIAFITFIISLIMFSTFYYRLWITLYVGVMIFCIILIVLGFNNLIRDNN